MVFAKRGPRNGKVNAAHVKGEELRNALVAFRKKEQDTIEDMGRRMKSCLSWESAVGCTQQWRDEGARGAWQRENDPEWGELRNTHKLV